MLEASRGEVLLAVDLYNQPAQARRIEGFYVHIHIAWLYLLHARFVKDGVDIRYRLPNGRFDRIDGEPRTWELKKCLEERWPADNDPTRKNLEFTRALRNKIEHRHQEAIGLATAGHAQACLLNYERELTGFFGDEWTLADSLRFPVFIGTFTQQGVANLAALHKRIPQHVQTFINEFTIGLDPKVLDDPQFEFRLHLVPQKSSRTKADMALDFVRLDELTDEERETLESLGREGRAVVVPKDRPVKNLEELRASEVVERVAEAIPFEFNMSHFVSSYKRLQVRPPTGSPNPKETDAKYCVYDVAHRDYVYTPALVKKLIRDAQTEDGFRKLTGRDPLSSVSA
jgi:hypothetical protein